MDWVYSALLAVAHGAGWFGIGFLVARHRAKKDARRLYALIRELGESLDRSAATISRDGRALRCAEMTLDYIAEHGHVSRAYQAWILPEEAVEDAPPAVRTRLAEVFSQQRGVN